MCLQWNIIQVLRYMIFYFLRLIASHNCPNFYWLCKKISSSPDLYTHKKKIASTFKTIEEKWCRETVTLNPCPGVLSCYTHMHSTWQLRFPFNSYGYLCKVSFTIFNELKLFYGVVILNAVRSTFLWVAQHSISQ